MKKREILEQVNKVNYWEKDSKLLDLLVADGRLEQHNRINTYSKKIADGMKLIYYSRDAVVIVTQAPDTAEVLDFEILCQDSDKNQEANRRR